MNGTLLYGRHKLAFAAVTSYLHTGVFRISEGGGAIPSHSLLPLPSLPFPLEVGTLKSS